MTGASKSERRITSLEVVKAVCDYHKVPVSLVKSEARDGKLVHIRYEIAYILKHKMGFSFPRIGKALNRAHSTVIYWLIKASKRRNAPGQAQIDIAETVWSNLTGG